ncbi:MAG TPA: glycine betaine ABC transporter substrate-binding protein, partial [Clostridia bacterium]|nr:glycine betaine ABC transporter substrate-binding protein [Clostridia bacterium]
MKRLFILALIFVMALSLAACGGATETENETENAEEAYEGPIRMADCGWDSNKFHNSVAGYIIENGFEMETEVIPGSTAAIFLGMKEGDVDVLIETWTDSIPTYAGDVESGEIIEIGTNMSDNTQGFYV